MQLAMLQHSWNFRIFEWQNQAKTVFSEVMKYKEVAKFLAGRNFKYGQ